MKQTAMQEHIEWLKATIEIAEEQYPILVNTLKLCLNDATQRLAMEKEQRERDFIAGNDCACMEHEDIKDYFDKYIKSE